MSDRYRAAVAVGVLLFMAAQAGANGPGRGDAVRPNELCEAFPWDVPVEQSFTAAAILRWRRGYDAARRAASLGRPQQAER
jgi:hypothetical protein